MSLSCCGTNVEPIRCLPVWKALLLYSISSCPKHSSCSCRSDDVSLLPAAWGQKTRRFKHGKGKYHKGGKNKNLQYLSTRLCPRQRARGYISCNQHNIPASPSELSAIRCIVGFLGTMFWQGRRMCQIKKLISLCLLLRLGEFFFFFLPPLPSIVSQTVIGLQCRADKAQKYTAHSHFFSLYIPLPLPCKKKVLQRSADAREWQG